LRSSVGALASNRRDDVKTVQILTSRKRFEGPLEGHRPVAASSGGPPRASLISSAPAERVALLNPSPSCWKGMSGSNG
jgi:hypothetical protein